MAAHRRERGAARVPQYRTKEGFALGFWLGTQQIAALDELGMG
ncbi:helicase associated domain-containing protein [Nocardia speluncae]|nr:helicase associated domain-containing protein [Nocardia speluncae]